MQLNILLKIVIISFLTLIIESCSIDNKTNKEHHIADIIDAIKNINRYKDDNILSNNAIYSNIKQLQQNNIIYFDLDRYDILPNCTTILDAHANFLYSNPSYRITIEGHTDKSGTPEYNIALGERRANAVKVYLQSKGVADNQISIISYGESKPAVIGYDEISHSKNRRAVLIY